MGKLVLFWSSTVICFSWDQNLTEVHWQMFFHELQHPLKPRFKGKHVTVRACHCFDQSKTGCRASVRVSTCHATTSTKLCFSSTFACSVAKNTFFARHLLHTFLSKQQLYCLHLPMKPDNTRRLCQVSKKKLKQNMQCEWANQTICIETEHHKQQLSVAPGSLGCRQHWIQNF